MKTETLDRPALASAAVLRAMSQIKPLLTTWPAILPTTENPELRPMAIGIHKPIMALLKDPTDENRKKVKHALSVLTRSREYWSVRDASGSIRHDIDANPVGAVSENHKLGNAENPKPRRPKPIKETFIVAVKVSAFKVTAMLNPEQLTPVPDGKEVMLAVTTSEGLTATAKLNAKSYRKAINAINEHGADKVAVIIQGRMVRAGTILDAGISAQLKKPKD